MAQSTNSSTQQIDLRFFRNVVLKALILFLVANLAFALWYPMPDLGRISVYNRLFPGRKRLPYGENPERAYNLSLYNLEAMFASHEISAGPKPENEYRVVLIGDSSTWGFLLPPEQDLSAYLNAAAINIPEGGRVRAFNLGYPVMSLTKDLLMLSYAMRFEPDLVIWLFTLESFPYDKQLFPDLLKNNLQPVRAIIETYNLKLIPDDPELIRLTYWDRTIAGSRRSLADLVRLQLYGVLWAATGIDQDIPTTFTPPMRDLPLDESFHNFMPPHLHESDLAFDVLTAGVTMAGKTPVLFINEPMFISQGENSHIRYNFFYPRWAYDDYRRMMNEKSAANGWLYKDLWDRVMAKEFSNSAVHLTPEGTNQLAQEIASAILEIALAKTASQ